jgi:uncharacterized membrane protein
MPKRLFIVALQEPSMSSTSIAFGALLALLGGVLFVSSDLELAKRMTALIPTGFGILLIVCGLIARNDKARKHAMHFAAMVGLVGCVMPLVMVIRKAIAGEFDATSRAGAGQLVMSALCGVFVVLCVKSFIDVRRARKQAEAAK